jgi:DNA gyrase subunit A
LTTVDGQEDIMVMTNQGVMIRFNIATVSQTGRATLGVRLIRLDDDGKVATMAKVDPEPEGDEPTDANATEGATDDTAASETASVEETPAATPNDGTTGSDGSDNTDSSDDSAE